MTNELETYFKENYSHLIKIARRRVGNYSLQNAEDAVQEAFARACKYHRSYNRKESFDKWFKGILHNCINQIKRDERNQGVSYENVDDLAADPESTPITKEIYDQIENLSERDRNIVNLYFFYSFKSREIHEFLNISHDVVRDVIRRFRIKVAT